MAQVYKVDKATTLRWPWKCVVCGSPDVVTVKAQGQTVDDIAIPFGVMLRVSEYTVSLPYPICRLDKRLWLITRLGLLLLALGVAIAVGLLVYAIFDFAWGPIVGVLLIGAAIYLVWRVAKNAAPVHVYRIRDKHYLLRVQNDSYARDLEHVNADKLGVW